MISKTYAYKVKAILIDVLNDPKHTLRLNGRNGVNELLYNSWNPESEVVNYQNL